MSSVLLLFIKGQCSCLMLLHPSDPSISKPTINISAQQMITEMTLIQGWYRDDNVFCTLNPLGLAVILAHAHDNCYINTDSSTTSPLALDTLCEWNSGLVFLLRSSQNERVLLRAVMCCIYNGCVSVYPSYFHHWTLPPWKHSEPLTVWELLHLTPSVIHTWRFRQSR